VSACPACSSLAPPGARFCPACGARLSPQGPGATERKVVTTLFADLVGFTALGERADPEDVDAGLRAYYEMARTVIERFGGSVEKYIGDAVVGLFGVPAAHEDDAERAVRAALEIVAHMNGLPHVGDEELQVRAGVNTGPAFVRLHVRPSSGEGVLVGDAVNTAARLLAAAPPMTVVVGETTHSLSSEAIEYEELPPFVAKGKSRPVKTWLARAPISRRGVDLTRSYATPLIGREVEVGILKGVFSRACSSSQPQLALIVGEAGIGKTRLVFELARLMNLQPGLVANWRQGRCLPFGEGTGFQPLAYVVRDHAGIKDADDEPTAAAKLDRVIDDAPDRTWIVDRLRPLVGLAADPAEQDENFAAWARFLEELARRRPAVVVFDDLQWADDGLLTFLQHVLQGGCSAPLLLIGACRPELLDSHPGFAEYVRSATGVGRLVTRIDLLSLTPAETQRLVTNLSPRVAEEVAAAIVERAGGNPFFTEELVRLLQEDRSGDEEGLPAFAALPGSLQALLTARLDALDARQKSVLSDAAVVGQVFWPSALAAIGGTSMETVSESLRSLTERELVRPSPETGSGEETRFAFWHALTRDAAYAQLPRTVRAQKHAATGRWLEAQARDETGELTESIAHHYATAFDLCQEARCEELAQGLRGPAMGALMRAGDRALGLDVGAAKRHYERALNIAPHGDPARARILVRWAQALAQTGGLDAAVTTFEEGILELRRQGEERAAALAMIELSRIMVELADSRAAELADAALESIRDDGPSPELARLLEHRALIYLYEGDGPAAVDGSDRALQIDAALGLPESHRALMCRGVARCDAGDGAAALADLRQALALAKKQGPAGSVSAIHASLAEVLLVFEGPRQALLVHSEGIEIARRRRDEMGKGYLEAGRFEDLALAGEWDTALASCGDLQALLESHGQALALQDTLCIKAILLALRGGEGIPLAQRALDEAVHIAPFSSAHPGLVAGATVSLAAGDRGAARRYLAMLGSSRASLGSVPTLAVWWPLVLRTALRLGSPELVERVAGAMPPAIRAIPHSWTTVSALLAERDGAPDEAAVRFADAASRWRGLAVPLEEGEAHFGAGRCLAAQGDERGAAVALSDARTIFTRLGARPSMAAAGGGSATGGSARLR